MARARPALALEFLLGVVSAPKPGFRPWLDAVAVVGGFIPEMFGVL